MAQKLWFECSGEHRDLRRGGSENSDKTTVETMHLYIDLDRKVKYFYRINDGKFYDQAGIVSVEEDVKWHEEKGIADGSINRRSLVLEQSSHLYVGDMLYENYYSMQCKIVSAPSAPARQF